MAYLPDISKIMAITVTLLLPSAADASVSLDPTVQPSVFWILPFAVLLAVIAVFPLLPKFSHWWEKNRNKLLVSVLLGGAVTLYYGLRGQGFAGAPAGLHSVTAMLTHAIGGDYVPFIVLLLSLYVISGGIRLSGDIPAHPATNCAFLLLGSLLASFIGTTGASMLLIRPLLQVNRERRHVKHTVVFFIFLVSNIGGALLPVGDPPLFLGYLRGVPFLWTLNLFWPWAMATGILLGVYFIFDWLAYHREAPSDILIDETRRMPLKLEGAANFGLLAAVILAVALLVPGRPIPFMGVALPQLYLREIVLLILAGISFAMTPRRIHRENHFNFHAINEVACIFIGIFVTMQVPVEILKGSGAALGINSPMQFFWLTGLLSSFLDNAPTYVVFFELAGSSHPVSTEVLRDVATGTGQIPVRELLAISCGAVFMGANTYIGNGPNFLVKSIAEHHRIKMPGFFGYMLWSSFILLPLFALISWIFLR